MAVLVAPPVDTADLESRWIAHANQNPKVKADALKDLESTLLVPGI